VPTLTVRTNLISSFPKRSRESALESVGIDVPMGFRESKEADKHYLFIAHSLELNDVLIAAALLNRTDPHYILASFIHERALKRSPYRVTWKENSRTETFSLIPDAFLDFRMALTNGQQRCMPIVLEHDRGTEGQQHFRRRIRAYLMLLKSGAYQQLFGVKVLAIAFTTFCEGSRLKQMRAWARAELAAASAPKEIAAMFLFTTLNKPLEPRQLWLEPYWYTLYSDEEAITLLGEGK
jgi:Replication-relaxation